MARCRAPGHSMARKKRLRFNALHKMDNVVDGRRCEPDWFERFFGREESVILELGCGRGEYTLALARRRPDSGVLGVDRNGARLWKGAEQALDEGLTNAFFLRAQIEHLEDHIAPGRVAEIWLPFPDPLPKNRQAKHRLLSTFFLERYRRLLYPGGVVHLKTDDLDLVDFADQAVRATGGRVLDGSARLAGEGEEVMAAQTTYEKRYRDEGRTIYDRRFLLN